MTELLAEAGRAPPHSMLQAELIAVLVAVGEDRPRVLTLAETAGAEGAALPSGPLEPAHRSLQSGLRSWVEQQTHHPVGHI